MKLKIHRFLWVKLQIENLCDSRRIKIEGDLVDELARLPRSLADMYSLILKNIGHIEQRGRTLAEIVMKWLLCTEDASSGTTIALCSGSLSSGQRSLSISDILDVCSTLVVYDEALDRFRFAHLSVREFLESQQAYTPSEANRSILERSLQTVICNQPSRDRDFWVYATLYWIFHYNRLQEQDRKEFFVCHAKSFLFNGPEPSDAFKIWKTEAYRLNRELWYEDEEEPQGLWPKLKVRDVEYYKYRTHFQTPINLASCLGWLEILDYFHASQDRDYFHSSALEMMDIAIDYGQTSVMTWLLARSIFPTDQHLYLTINDRKLNIVQTLLEMKILSFNTLICGHEVLVLAVRSGFWDLYQYLIENGADRRYRDQKGRTLLSHGVSSIRYDHRIFEDLLLGRIDLREKNEYESIPFWQPMMSYHCYKSWVKSEPIESTATIDDENMLRGVLQLADQHTKCLLYYYGVKSMLEEGNMRAEWTQILNLVARLHGLQQNASASVIEWSRKRFHDPEDGMQLAGQALLSLAALSRHEKAFQALLDLGIDPTCPALDTMPKGTSTVAQIRHLMSGEEATVQENEGDIERMSDEVRQGPLAWAAYTGDLLLVQSILNRGLNPSIRNRKGQTALYFAVQETEGRNQQVELETNKEAIVRLLLRRGALVTSADAYGGATLLRNAFKARYSRIATILLQFGADIPDGATNGPMKRLLGTFDQGEEGVRQALLKRLGAAQGNSSDAERSSSHREPLDICAQLIRGGTMRVLGDDIPIDR